MSEHRPRLILGAAGHIDHGKTSLVRRLTGIDTDRLPEEKRRGITIDLGFANLDLPTVRFGVVDVPGHERFVHNMVAGAVGVDLAMLVVAADDSIMPQTREHLAILQLLGIRCGLCVVSKIDLVDQETLEIVTGELNDFFVGTFLEGAPIQPVSSETGEGLEELKAKLGRLAESYERPVRRSGFRLPIDRAFAVPGHGVVVTGTVYGGVARVGDELTLLPGGLPVRVRRLQSHNADEDSVEAGQRSAVNLAGVKVDQVRRGDELTEPGLLSPSRRLLAEVVLLPDAKPLQDRRWVRVHLATREVTARLSLRGGRIEPGAKGYAELRLQDPVFADYGQRYILRQLSPAATLGGGRILDPAIPTEARIRDLVRLGQQRSATDPADRLASWLTENDLADLTPKELSSRLGIEPQDRDSIVDRLMASKALIRMPSGLILHRGRRDELGAKIVERCRREIGRRPPSRVVERSLLKHVCRRLSSPTLLDAVIDECVAEGRLALVGGKIGLPGLSASLTKNQQKLLSAMVDRCRRGGFAPPLLAELAKELNSPLKDLARLANLGVEDGLLVWVADGLYFVPEALDALAKLAVDRVRKEGPATVAELRDLWNVSRKHAVPICEYLDQQGVTRRQGDVRGLGPKATLITE